MVTGEASDGNRLEACDKPTSLQKALRAQFGLWLEQHNLDLQKDIDQWLQMAPAEVHSLAGSAQHGREDAQHGHLDLGR
jgi:hypothetical protein